MAKRKSSKTTQLSLFEGQEKTWEIKKHSSMAQISNVPTLQERKTMNALIWIAKDILKREPDKKVFDCDISTVKRLTGMQATQNEELKDALRNLAETTIEYNIFGKDKSKERGIFSFLAYAKVNEQGKGKVTNFKFEFPSIILDMVKRPNMYVTLNLLTLSDLDSKHSVGLYEFLKDYKNL